VTVGDLMDVLSQYDKRSDIRIMSQPNYPFEYDVEGIWQNENDDTDDAFVISDDGDEDNPGPKPVFIVEGHQRGYGTKRAWQEVVK
jgi:hypothetical protein